MLISCLQFRGHWYTAGAQGLHSAGTQGHCCHSTLPPSPNPGPRGLLVLAVERRFHPRAQGCGGRAGPREVLAATVIDAARQAGAGCSQSCTAGVSTTGTGEQLRQALWSSRESSEPGACSFKAFLSQQQRAPCLALACSSQCSLGLGGRRGCTPAMGVSGASFPALTLQLSPGVPPQVGSQGARCACLPPSSSGAHCSVPGGSVPGGVAFLSQPSAAGHSAHRFWVTCLCPLAASAWPLVGWGWPGCLSTVRALACVQSCAWNSFPNPQIR